MDGCRDLAFVETPMQLTPMPRGPRQAVLVLGMSRSGTSLLANVLHALGAVLPQDVIGAAHGNPLGHFEPRALVALNDTILHRLDRRWDDPRPIPANWFRSRQAYECLRQIVAQIGQSYGDAPLIVIKDPRLCRLLPLYLDALDVLEIEPLVILQVRALAEVAQSLAGRDAMPAVRAELLWLRSVIEAELHSRDCQRVWVGMAELLADWRGTVCRISDSLRLQWPIDRDEALGEIASRLKPRRSHRAEPVASDGPVTRVADATWQAAQLGLAGDEAAARAAFDAVRVALTDLDRMCEPYLSEIAAMHNSWSWRLTAPLRALRRGVAGGVAQTAGFRLR